MRAAPQAAASKRPLLLTGPPFHLEAGACAISLTALCRSTFAYSRTRPSGPPPSGLAARCASSGCGRRDVVGGGGGGRKVGGTKGGRELEGGKGGGREGGACTRRTHATHARGARGARTRRTHAASVAGDMCCDRRPIAACPGALAPVPLPPAPQPPRSPGRATGRGEVGQSNSMTRDWGPRHARSAPSPPPASVTLPSFNPLAEPQRACTPASPPRRPSGLYARARAYTHARMHARTHTHKHTRHCVTAGHTGARTHQHR